MTDFMINVPKEWTEKQKEELQIKLIKSKVFGKDDSVFITNKYVIHQVDTKTYDMLEDMKKRLDDD